MKKTAISLTSLSIEASPEVKDVRDKVKKKSISNCDKNAGRKSERKLRTTNG
jgi:hypothetical protein